VANGKMVLNDLGKIIEQFWNEIPKHYPNVGLDYYIVMPNHVHGIIIINDIVEK
jgi:REP element-mobilizing transposase RayT